MKIVVILGTRPEGIKFAPLILALQNEPNFECIVVNTGQHIEMLDQVLALFSIQPKYNLGVMKPNQSPLSLTANILPRIDKILAIEQPTLVLVLGDTATTFSGAYAAFLRQIPVTHIEAGLRTNQRYSPFPEEMYRRVVCHLSTIHFAPTKRNKQNLIAENIPRDQIMVVGNTVIDALLQITSQPYQFPPFLQTILERGNRIILVTTHRRENFFELKYIYQALNEIVQEFDDIEIIFPTHLNPQVQREVAQHVKKHSRIHITNPLDYECFAHLMKHSYLILTDSGGIQEEAPALNVPVLVTRKSTERQEGVEAGTLRLVGTNASDILTTMRALLQNLEEYRSMADAVNPYGDGTSSKKIVEYLKKLSF